MVEVYVNVGGTRGCRTLIVNVARGHHQERYEVPATRRKLLNLLEEVVVALRETEDEAG